MQEEDQASPKQMTGKRKERKKHERIESVKNERKEGSVA